MKQEINLINEQIGRKFSLLRYRKKINFLTLIFIILFIILSSGTMVTIYLLNRNLNQSMKKITLLEGQIKNLEKNESYATVVANRISVINSLLKSRKSFAEAISNLKFLLVPNFQLSALEITPTGGWRLSGFCTDLQTLSKIYEIAEQLKLNPKYAGLSYPKVDKDIGEGGYNLTMELK